MRRRVFRWAKMQRGKCTRAHNLHVFARLNIRICVYIKRFSQQQQKNQEGAPRFRAKNQTEARRHTSVLGRVGKAWGVVCMYRERASAILSIAEMPLPFTKKNTTLSRILYMQLTFKRLTKKKRQEKGKKTDVKLGKALWMDSLMN